MEHHLQQHVTEFLAEGPVVAGLEGLERLVWLLQQVRGERRWVWRESHGHSTRSRSMVATRSSRCAPGRSAEPRSSLAPGGTGGSSPGSGSHTTSPSAAGGSEGARHDLVADSGLVQGRQLRMPGRGQHGVSGPQRLPGGPVRPGATRGLVARTISKSATAPPATLPWPGRRP